MNYLDKNGLKELKKYMEIVVISDTQPTNSAAKIWINNGTMKYKNGEEWATISGSGSGDTEPLASTKMYFGTTEPSGYKFANGQALSKAEYPELFSLIGETYGGDHDTFNLPDMSGLVPVGLKVNSEWFNSLGKTGGQEEVTLTIEQMPAHNHGIRSDNVKGTVDAGATFTWGTAYSSFEANASQMTGGGQAHTNLQPYIVVNYIIKVKNIASEQTIVPDYIPIGTEFNYDGETVPDGYEEVEPSKKLIWTNSKTNSDFAEQTISKDLTTYDSILIKLIENKSDTPTEKNIINFICYKDEQSRIMTISFTNEQDVICNRRVKMSKDGIYFTNCSAYGIGSSSIASFLNNLLIPYQIYGIKEVS